MANPAPPKTTISTTSSSGVAIIQPSQDPVLVTSSGNITTTDLYALNDVVVPATVTNDGTLSGQNGVGAPGAGSSVFNFGTVTGTSAEGVALQGGGTVTNGSNTNSTASITGSLDGIRLGAAGAATTGTIANFGTVKGGNGINAGSGTVTLTNSGTIIGTSNDGVLASSGMIANSGTIAAGKNSVELGSGGNIVNGSNSDQTASITGGSDGILIRGTTTSTVANFGKIAGAGSSNGIEASGQVTITNGSDMDTKASITGGSQGNGIVSGAGTTVNNFGSVAGSTSGITLGNGGSITNGSAGDTTASIFGNTTGVGIAGSSSGTVTNFGGVTGGVSLGTGGGTVTNGSATDKGATITASANGTAVAIGGSGTVTNFGTIKSNNAGIVFTGSGTVMNAGTITSGSGAPAIVFGKGTGTLQQAPGSTINGSIANFGSGDSIDLLGVPSTGAGINYSASTGGLTITAANGGPLAMLSFQNSSLGPGTFHTASDGRGGTLITHS
jgi:hypothetical protein